MTPSDVRRTVLALPKGVDMWKAIEALKPAVEPYLRQFGSGEFRESAHGEYRGGTLDRETWDELRQAASGIADPMLLVSVSWNERTPTPDEAGVMGMAAYGEQLAERTRTVHVHVRDTDIERNAYITIRGPRAFEVNGIAGTIEAAAKHALGTVQSVQVARPASGSRHRLSRVFGHPLIATLIAGVIVLALGILLAYLNIKH